MICLLNCSRIITSTVRVIRITMLYYLLNQCSICYPQYVLKIGELLEEKWKMKIILR